MTHTSCPDDVVKRMEHECGPLLSALCRQLNLPRAAVSFVTDEQRFGFRAALITDPSHTLAVRPVSEGLMGQALQLNETLVWPNDERTQRTFLKVDARTCLEIASPIHLHGEPTGVLLIDFFAGEEVEVDKDLIGRIEAYAKRISSLIEATSATEVTLRQRLIDLAESCKNDTRSKRGYIALKDWDDELVYVWRDEQGVFLILNITEGLCGRAFREGRPVNVGYVWDDPAYVASDPEINSELIIPIVSNKEVIAILNMESERRNFYTPKKEEIAEKYAREAAPLLEQFRTASIQGRNNYGMALGALVEEAVNAPRYEDFDDFRDIEIGTIEFIKNKLVTILNGEPELWLNAHDNPPAALKHVKWSQQMQGGIHTISDNDGVQKFCIFAPVRTYGEIKSIVGITLRERPTSAAGRLVQQFCRVAGRVIDIKIEAAKSIVLERTLKEIMERPNSVTLAKAARAIKVVTVCSHCTIFAKVQVGLKYYLCVAVSTSDEVFEISKEELFYRVDEADGLTGFVAQNAKELIPKDVKERNGGPTPHWKGKLSEELDYSLSAFVGMPIVDLKSQDLIGVVRLHRSKKKGHRGAFDDESIERLRLICQIIGAAYGERGLMSTPLGKPLPISG